MTFNKRKIIGAVFSVLAVTFIALFISKVEFSIQFPSYFSLKYYVQFIPLSISVMLLVSGIFLIIKRSATNFALSLFGFTALEEILFDWFGLTTTLLPTYAVVLFFCCALIALWIAYSNTFKFKRLSYRQGVITVIIATIEGLLPYFL